MPFKFKVGDKVVVHSKNKDFDGRIAKVTEIIAKDPNWAPYRLWFEEAPFSYGAWGARHLSHALPADVVAVPPTESLFKFKVGEIVGITNRHGGQGLYLDGYYDQSKPGTLVRIVENRTAKPRDPKNSLVIVEPKVNTGHNHPFRNRPISQDWFDKVEAPEGRETKAELLALVARAAKTIDEQTESLRRFEIEKATWIERATEAETKAQILRGHVRELNQVIEELHAEKDAAVHPDIYVYAMTFLSEEERLKVYGYSDRIEEERV